MTNIALFCDTPKTKSGIVMYCESLKALLEEGGEYSVSVFSSLPYKRYFSLFNVYDRSEIRSALRSKDFDIIHINGFISTLPFFVTSAMRSLKMHTPFVYTPHAHPFHTLRHPFRNRIFFHLFVKPVLRRADAVISINKEDFAFFTRYNRNVVTIPHWSNRDIEARPKPAREKPVILFVGRNDDNKNLKALYSLPTEKYEVICVTNTKPERDDFVFRTRISDEELSALYASASLTVVPSRYEAFSYTALESLLAGTPVLLSDRVRIADFLDGTGGVTVYDYEKPEEFSQNIDGAMGKRVDVEKVHRLFSAEGAREQYMNVYKSVMEKNRCQK